MPTSYEVNSPAVIREDLDGEVVVIHLETGSYYSLRGAGAEAWRRVEGGADAELLASHLRARFRVEPGDLAAEVEAFLGELEAQQLIRPRPEGAPALEALAAEGSEPAAWEGLKLEAYMDMKDLLMLDPIHEADETGWPATPPAQGT